MASGSRATEAGLARGGATVSSVAWRARGLHVRTVVVESSCTGCCFLRPMVAEVTVGLLELDSDLHLHVWLALSQLIR